MAPPPLQVSSVTIGAPDPRELAAFYERFLGWTVSALEALRPATHRRPAGRSCGPRQGGRAC